MNHDYDHQASIHREFTLGYVTHKIDNDERAPKVYAFPPSREGLQTVKNKKELSDLLQNRFREMFPSPQMQYPYQITEGRGTSAKRQGERRLIAHCRICTNRIIYVRKTVGESLFRLVKMGEYHVHGKDPNKVQEMRRRTQHHARWTLRLGRPYEVKPIYLDEMTDTSIEAFIKCLPVEITNSSRCRIVCERFKITKNEYQSVMRSIRAQFQISLKELFDRFTKKNYMFKFLPENLIDINQEWIANQKINEYLSSIRHYDVQNQKNVHQIDETNPDIPNVLLIVTPQMKDLYHKYGQYIGFDLTFNLINEKPNHQKEYLVGVMAGTSQSRRILIYGLVITKNQTEYVYKYIFKEFFKIMGKCPETIVTDQEMSLHYALEQLRQEGTFTGKHLLDMFHVLKKFRKSCEPQTFQLFRKMMHSKDRQEYRKALEEAMQSITSDEELEILRNFDYNSDRYCYSQTDASFVGIGISDSMNEKYHDLIKAQLPYETKYIKAVNTILDLIQSRNQLNRYGIIDKNPLQEKMSMDFMKQYRTVLSDKVFYYIFKQVCKSFPYVILSDQQSKRYNLKIEQGERVFGLNNRDRYIVKTNTGFFTVYKAYETQEAINQSKRNIGRWKCHCQFQQRSGYLCSHLAKVLITLRLDFYDNIHPRWILPQSQIEQGIKKYIYRERKFHHYSRIRMRKFPKWHPTQNQKENDAEKDLDISQLDLTDFEDETDNSSVASTVYSNMNEQDKK